MPDADHRALIEEARSRHHECQPGTTTTGGCYPACGTCHFCRDPYPCLPARLAEALEAALAWPAAVKEALSRRVCNNYSCGLCLKCSSAMYEALEPDAGATFLTRLEAAERRAAELEAARDAWQADAVERARNQHFLREAVAAAEHERDRALEQRDQAEHQREEMRAALVNWGEHGLGCARRGYDHAVCDCGFYSALADGRGEAGE